MQVNIKGDVNTFQIKCPHRLFLFLQQKIAKKAGGE